MSPDGGLSPGTSLFSIFLSPALLFPPTFFFLPFLRGFLGGSGWRTVSAAKPAERVRVLRATRCHLETKSTVPRYQVVVHCRTGYGTGKPSS